MNRDDNDQKLRASDLGIPFEGAAGEFNAITDVPGVEVGFTTMIEGSPKDASPLSAPELSFHEERKDSFLDYVFAGEVLAEWIR